MLKSFGALLINPFPDVASYIGMKLSSCYITWRKGFWR